MTNRFADLVREAGVLGCGGAGFPAHVKASSSADTVIGNGAECEPLLHKDLELLAREAPAVVRGVRLMMESTGAKRGVIGVKKKYAERLGTLRQEAEREGVELLFLGDFYPTGDEYILVYEATRRLIPPRGIPLNVGVVVSNVETLRNMSCAADGIPVTRKYVTIAGAVRNPVTLEVPIGIPFEDCIAAAGGPKEDAVAGFAGGVMMGSLTRDFAQPVTKTTAGLILLPAAHRLVARRDLKPEAMDRVGKSACDQCSYCTELCPRYLLGYDVQPHKVMRSLSFTATGEGIWNQYADLCCSCGLCTLYSCPEDLYPKEACDRSKAESRARGISWQGKQDVAVHPIYDGRHVPLGQLMKKLGIEAYNVPAPFADAALRPERVTLAPGAGAPAGGGAPNRLLVRPGERVEPGQVVGEHSGVNVHASIAGVVRLEGEKIVIEQQRERTRQHE
ncbi:MAG TPA: 4Fe-4S dicluster domain-containing protein [Bacteroidota bacterium]|nr:4Fe-4S dicluster domain-containing protein [Bacteroidota bacterium]